MEIQPIDTLAAQREALEACSADVYEERVMEPLEPLWKPFVSRFPAPPDPEVSAAMSVAGMMGFYTPADGCAEGLDAIAAFDEAGTWPACIEAARSAVAALDPTAHGLDIPTVRFTLALGSLRTLDLATGAYTGAQQPEAAMVLGYPNPVGTPRLPVASAHEVNHIVRFAFEPFMPDLTLGKYLVAEGLAECFGLEVVGDPALVGPYCTALSDEEAERLAPRFVEGLEESDFGVVRGYMFGDGVADRFHFPKQNVPDFAGYAIGFRLVRTYLERTGTRAAEATYVPWREIVEDSGFLRA